MTSEVLRRRELAQCSVVGQPYLACLCQFIEVELYVYSQVDDIKRA
jgi:hypothetical protein